jgi:hypothetical protein
VTPEDVNGLEVVQALDGRHDWRMADLHGPGKMRLEFPEAPSPSFRPWHTEASCRSESALSG